jgi:GNAT superfamily N-acetyltransferase
MAPGAPPVTDAALSRRLERAEALASVAFVESRARAAPALGAAWREVAGAHAMFDGVGSPITQTFGLALFAPARGEDLAELEAFFAERGADVHHEVSPMADPALLALLPARGYRPVELTSLMHRPFTEDDLAEPPPSAVRARRIAPGEEDLWAHTASLGWGETPELGAFVRELGGVSARSAGTSCFLAEIDGAPVAAASLAVHGGVALLAGASTVPAWRGRGAQAALLRARLRHAASLGCDLAMMGAAPGSGSQRNAERSGFRIAYTRIKWGRPHGAPTA